MPITTAADDIHKYIFFHCFQGKQDLINQALISSKGKSKKLKCRLLQFLFGALRVKASSRKFGYNFHLIYMTSAVGRVSGSRAKCLGFDTHSGNVLSFPLSLPVTGKIFALSTGYLFRRLDLPRSSVVRLTDCPDTIIAVYCGRKTTTIHDNVDLN